MPPPPPPPNRVPVLTEVVLVPRADAPMASPAPTVPLGSGALPTLSPAAAVVVPDLPDENALVERVMSDLHRQIDLMFEQRIREKLLPALARIADMMVREVRTELSGAVREMVERAVANELARHRRR